MEEEFPNGETSMVSAKEITAKQFFDIIKNRKETINNHKLQQYYESCLKLIKKFQITGQTDSLKKLQFHISCMEKELKLLELGIDTYIEFSEIKKFIQNVKDEEILLVEMSDFPREIPDELIPLIEQTKEIFDKFYILFTDYTGEIKQDITEKREKEKDPILFGAFVSNGSNITKLERFYYLGDWIDEYCDLTLEKLLSKGAKSNTISEKNIEEIKQDIENYKEQSKNEAGGTEFTYSFTQKIWNQDITSNDILINDIPMYDKKNEKPKKNLIQRIKSWMMK